MKEDNKLRGVKLLDGSGKGERANYNRSGCRDGESCEIGDMIRREYRRGEK